MTNNKTKQTMINELRAAYANVQKIDPCGPAYTKLVALLNSLPQDMLRELADANIKFVSLLARNRVKK